MSKFLQLEMLLDECPKCRRPFSGPIPNVDLAQSRVGSETITSQETSLLTLLVRRLGFPISNRFIIECLWGQLGNGGPDDPGTQIRVMVTRLNKKLEKIGYKVVNIRAYGYKLVKLPDEIEGAEGVKGVKGDQDGKSINTNPTA